jgi:hypothetical protein
VNRAAASGDRCRRRGRRGLRHRRADAPGPSRDCVLRCQIKSNGGMHCRAKLGPCLGCVHFPSQPKIFPLPPITSNLSTHA